MNQQRDEDVVMQTDLGMNMVVNDDLKFYCELCKLSATSQIVLDAHLKGSRHAKEVSKNYSITFLIYLFISIKHFGKFFLKSLANKI